jgi:simple sugar transport system permease protein
MSQARKIWERVGAHPLFWPLLALLLVMLFNLVYSPEFFKIEFKDGHLYGSLIDILNRGTPLMLVAIGMTLVIATGGVDLSVGPVIAITGAVAASLIGTTTTESITKTPLPLVILIPLVCAMLGGLWNGMLVSRAGVQPVVATLILMVAGRGVAQLITRGQILTIYYTPYYFVGASGSSGYILGLPFPLYLLAAVLIMVALLTRRTAIGLFIESIGINASSSFHSGINEKNVKLLVYTLCGLCAGVAGLIISSNIKSADANNAGALYELDAILSVVIGGTSLAGGRFSLLGSVLGALIVQSLTTTIYSVGVPPEVAMVVKAIVVLLVSLVQSEHFRNMVFGGWLSRKGVAQ